MDKITCGQDLVCHLESYKDNVDDCPELAAENALDLLCAYGEAHRLADRPEEDLGEVQEFFQKEELTRFFELALDFAREFKAEAWEKAVERMDAAHDDAVERHELEELEDSARALLCELDRMDLALWSVRKLGRWSEDWEVIEDEVALCRPVFHEYTMAFCYSYDEAEVRYQNWAVEMDTGLWEVSEKWVHLILDARANLGHLQEKYPPRGTSVTLYQ